MRVEWLPSGRLGRQIASAFIGYGALLIIALSSALLSGLKAVERDILDDTLRLELAHFRFDVASARMLGAFQSRTMVIHAMPLDSIEEMPAQLTTLSSGIHEINREGRDYRVLVEEVDGIRYTVQYDTTNIHQRERTFTRWVWVCSIATLLLSLVFGLWIALRLSRPSQRLAQQIRDLSKHPTGSLDLSQFQDDEIGLLAKRLQDHHEQLNALVTREKEFAGNVSHELRTPITTISLAVEVLAAKSDISAQNRDRLQRIERATGEMLELVDTFLVLSQIDESTALHVSGCDLRPIVDEVIKQQRVWLGNKPIEVRVDDRAAVTVAAPANVLSVLIANLVRNAFRYTQQGTIEVTLDPRSIRVSDTGVGIDPRTQSKLFERHTRGKTGDTDGAGLGLSIVRRICERYHWSVSVHSDEGSGSQFTVDFGPESATAP